MAKFSRVGLEIKKDSTPKLEGEYSQGKWAGVKLNEEHVLLSRKSEKSRGLSGFGFCDSDVLVGLLYGIVRKRFTGVLDVLIGNNTKALYFELGELVFAKSDLMDDRLGEVIYREGQITMEQMTDAAVEVTRERKFGQVLLDSGEYNSADLWDFLKLQVREIFQSIFLSRGVFYRVAADNIQPPISVILEQSTEQLIQKAASFSQMFRGFKGRVGLDSKLLLSLDESEVDIPQGTHLFDMVELIKESPSIKELLELSKLSENNTYINLLKLVVRQYVEVEHLEDAVQVVPDAGGPQRELKGYIDAYHVVLRTSVKAFEDAKIPFPFEDLDSFVSRLYTLTGTPLFLKTDGTIAVESVRHLYEKGRGNLAQQKEIAWAMKGLIQFVLQITGDLLPKGFAVKKSIQEMLV